MRGWSATTAAREALLAWQVHPKVGYRVSRLVEVAAAYRVFSMDYSGSGNPAFVYDMRTFGPELGVALHF